MTRFRGLALLLTVAAAGALVRAAGSADDPAATVGPRLKTISSHMSAKGASLVIEASDPIAYVATRPDPLTLVLDFRNVVADGVANAVVADIKSPIAAVSVEPVDSVTPATSRVRVQLLQPVAHHVRSERNTIVIDFEKAAAKAAPYVLPPASRRDGAVPDAMMALAPPAVDPIAVLNASRPQPAAPKTTATAAQASQAGPSAPAPLMAVMPFAPSAAPVNYAPQAAPAQQPPTIVPTEPPSPTRKFSGNPISLDFQNVDLRSVLRVFSDISSLNLVIDPAVTGTVDVALRDVPWDQALDIILRANKLGFLVDGTIVRIAPLATLADEEAQRRKLTDEQALSGTLSVLTQTLSYAKAEELAPLLTKSALSPRGIIQVDVRTNTLIISDLPEKLTIAGDLIGKLDRPQPQVEIEARIVQANKNYARQLGIQWGFNGNVSPQLGNTTNLAFPNSIGIGGRAGGTSASGTSNAVNLAAPTPNSAIGLALGSINGAFNLDVALSAAETSGNLRILSTPRVSAQNNGEAEITQGVQIPIQTVSNNTVTVSFRDAALTLKVTPQITAAGTVIMKIALENSSPDFSRAVNGIPPINTQRANTNVLVSDGQTTVIGGIFTSQEQSLNDKTPGLGQVPILRWLFKRDTISDQSTELLIFITPRIIKS